MIAAPKSGSGKTIITCGLLQILKDAGTDVRAYKCGPDYIDPMFHRRVIGVPGGNLDLFFSGEDEISGILGRSAAGAGAAVIEGAMGIYDGIAGEAGLSGAQNGSCYNIAVVTDTPVVLVVDVRGMGQTMLSVIKGILADDTACMVRGLILNRISPRYYRTIEPVLREALRIRDVVLLGGIPETEGIHLESRHLGLMMPDEIEDLRDQVAAAADLIRKHLDLEGLTDIMRSAAGSAGNDPSSREFLSVHNGSAEPGLTLAVARDEAFCFYYEENLRMLADAGLDIVEFSPVHDSCLPDGADGLLLGGGYPELYAAELSSNTSMAASVRTALSSGMPSLAECGGFMYLLEQLTDRDGRTYTMAGALSGNAYYTGRLSRFGYITVSGADAGSDSLLSGLCVKGHEFHYYDSADNGSDALAVKPGSGRSWPCIHAGPGHIWGYPHLYYPSCPELVNRFRTALYKYHIRNTAKK